VGTRNTRRPKYIFGESQLILIAHRGNISGPNPETENTISQLLYAIKMGFDVEVDVWVVEGKMYFGHDEPKHLVSSEDFYKVCNHAWFHCKNLESLNHFIKYFPTYNYFWHQLDDFTLTSNNKVWTYPGMEVGPNSIIVDLEATDIRNYNNIYGICSDKVLLLKTS
jgi:hypothetical protein